MRGSEVLVLAQSCVEVDVIRLVNLGAVLLACQQRASVASAQIEAASAAQHKRAPEREHADCGVESLSIGIIELVCSSLDGILILGFSQSGGSMSCCGCPRLS